AAARAAPAGRAAQRGDSARAADGGRKGTGERSGRALPVDAGHGGGSPPFVPPDRRDTSTGRHALAVALVIIAMGAVALWTMRPTATDAPRIRSIAVLPLQNLSRDPDQEFFSDGTTEALISNLAQIHDLDVISRTSAMRYKGTTKTVPEISRELGVDAILEGSVQRVGGAVRITVQLIRASTDKHLWAREYRRDAADVLTLEAEIARTIAQEIQAHLTPEEAT